ncbi:MAG: glycoside hydrolase family 43 protein [Prevotella sp.]|nr:glycoside hydrolase family 43 protein [Prevotella sp.]
MKKLLTIVIFLSFSLVAFAQGTQSFRNPIIPGFHPDPSVCRVGDDFYLVNSSFQYFPGVPIFHSKDLVNWEQIGNVLDRESQLPLKDASSWLGIYAPTIRYHEGTYYMITTNVGNGGNFMVTAKDPKGPWSEPIWLKQQGIDPSLYFENGKCYMASNPGDCIWLCEIDPQTGEQLTESRPLWQGDGGRYPEGPHIYKKDGWYYLLISEGGTELAHHLTIARSRDIYGPYESNPANPILTNCCRLGQSKQIQGTGHGDFVQAPDGSWWVVFLAYRNYGGSYHHLGRETYLAPMEWKEGEWPVVNGNGTIDTIVVCQTLPQVAVTKKPIRTTFKNKQLGPEWVYLQNPRLADYEFKGGKLRLHGSENDLTSNKPTTFVGHRQEANDFRMETEVTIGKGKDGECLNAGLAIYQINDGHYDFYVSSGDDGYLSVMLDYEVKGLHHCIDSGSHPAIGMHRKDVKSVFLRVSGKGQQYVFEYSLDGNSYMEIGRLNSTLLSTEVVGGFTGVTIGMFAQGKGYADFSYFDYEER